MRAEPTRTRNQPHKTSRGNIKEDLKKNGQQDLLMEGLEDVPVEETCERTREKFIPLDIDYEGDRISESLFLISFEGKTSPR